MNSTDFTFTSSATRSAYGRSRSASGVATVSFASGSRTRSPFALRRDSAAEHTSRTASISATSDRSAGNSPTDGQSVRCTERPPVRPRQISSESNGANGAVTRLPVSSTVDSVSKASRSPDQNRLRDRRTYQLVSASR